ncbi:hypothetical protein [Pseudoalteromonas marina]|uniref:hypothetical protein n=1 Tax=Pseudoalteromonas marina TaxID=267375 RepID=UPI003C315EF6
MSDSFECPRCKKQYAVSTLELWEVYAEDGKETEFDCSNCDSELIITSMVEGWSFEAELVD